MAILVLRGTGHQLAAVGWVWLYRVGRRPWQAGLVGLHGEPYPREPAPARWWAYTAFALAFVVLLASPSCRYAAQTPLNAECTPMVVAPGTTVRVHLDNNLQSVKGKWGGHGQVTVRNADDFPNPPELVVEVPPPQQDELIFVGKDEKSTQPDTYIAIALPDDPALVGKTLRLRMNLAVTYPKLMRGDQFEYVSSRLTEERDLVLVTRSEQLTDLAITVLGSLVGFGLASLGGFLILLSDYRLRRSNPLPQVLIKQVEW